MWFEFSAGVAEEIEQAEKGNIPIRFYNLKSRCYQGLHASEGDVILIINAMADYADILMEFVRQTEAEGLFKAYYEHHAERCRKISEKLQVQVGYDRDSEIERCRAKRKRKEADDDVGEEALVMMVRRGREKKKGENHEREDIRGNQDNGGAERAGEQSEKDERI